MSSLAVLIRKICGPSGATSCAVSPRHSNPQLIHLQFLVYILQLLHILRVSCGGRMTFRFGLLLFIFHAKMGTLHYMKEGRAPKYPYFHLVIDSVLVCTVLSTAGR